MKLAFTDDGQRVELEVTEARGLIVVTELPAAYKRQLEQGLSDALEYSAVYFPNAESKGEFLAERLRATILERGSLPSLELNPEVVY